MPEFIHRFGKRLVVFDAVGIASDDASNTHPELTKRSTMEVSSWMA